MKKIALILTLALFAVFGIQADNGKLSNRTKMLLHLNREAKSTGVNRTHILDVPVKSDIVSAYVRINGKYQKGTVERLGGEVRNYFEKAGILTVNLPIDVIETLAKEEGVVAVDVSGKVKLMMDTARIASNANAMIDGVQPLTHGYTGNGVVVGAVDGSFHPGHINFFTADQQKFRVKYFWNQQTQMVYNDSAAIIDAGYDTANIEVGHGTHVMGIAAGADHTHNYQGIAQDADIAMVQYGPTGADVMDGVKAMFDLADSLGEPAVVNLSLGYYSGPHDGTGMDSRIGESLVGPGRILSVSAGNSGYIDYHLGARFSPSFNQLKTFLSMYARETDSTCWVDIWGDPYLSYDVQLVLYDRVTGLNVLSTPSYDAMTDSLYTLSVDTILVSGDTVNFDVMVGTQCNANNNEGNVSFEFLTRSLSWRYFIGVIVHAESGSVNIWTDCGKSTLYSDGKESEGWYSGNTNMTLNSFVADARHVIAVGAYLPKYCYAPTGSLAYFSSHGPTPDNRIKPEITAPGCCMTSSIPGGPKMNDYVDSTLVGDKKYYYATMSGTSMSSPYCAGVIASWLEAVPNLTYDDIVDAFAHTAKTDEDTGVELPDKYWGYGKLDAFNGLLYLLNLPHSGTDNVAENKLFGYFDGMAAHLAGIMGNASVRVFDMSGKEVYSSLYEDLTPGTEFTVNLSNMPQGVYLINVNNELMKVIR